MLEIWHKVVLPMRTVSALIALLAVSVSGYAQLEVVSEPVLDTGIEIGDPPEIDEDLQGLIDQINDSGIRDAANGDVSVFTDSQGGSGGLPANDIEFVTAAVQFSTAFNPEPEVQMVTLRNLSNAAVLARVQIEDASRPGVFSFVEEGDFIFFRANETKVIPVSFTPPNVNSASYTATLVVGDGARQAIPLSAEVGGVTFLEGHELFTSALSDEQKMQSVTAGDVNRDGLMDIVMLVANRTNRSLEIHTFQNQTNIVVEGQPLEFADPVVTVVDDQAYYALGVQRVNFLRLYDVDNDNQLEVVITAPGIEYIKVGEYIVSNGHVASISFASESLYSDIQSHIRGSRFRFWDTNADGLLDVIIYNADSRVALWTQRPDRRFVMTNEFNLSGHVELGDFAFLDHDDDAFTGFSYLGYDGLTRESGFFIGVNNQGDFSDDLLFQSDSQSSIPRERYGFMFDINNDGKQEYVAEKHSYSVASNGEVSSRGFLWSDPAECSFAARTYAVVDIDGNGALDYVNYCNDRLQFTWMIRFNSHEGQQLGVQVDVDLPQYGFSERFYTTDADNDNDTFVFKDFNLDGRLDVVASSEGNFKVFQNQGGRQSAPTMPVGLNSSVSNQKSEVTLSWSESTDANTSAANLRYNVAVYRVENGVRNFVVSPMADLETGHSLTGEYTNAGVAESKVVRGLEPGNYCWTVQARNTSGTYSPFADEACFQVHRAYADLELTMALVDKRMVDSDRSLGPKVEMNLTLTNAAGEGFAEDVVVSYSQPGYSEPAEVSVSSGTLDTASQEWYPDVLGDGDVVTATLIWDYSMGSEFEPVVEVLASSAFDIDSTPGNGNSGANEDDYVSESLPVYVGYAELTLNWEVQEREVSGEPSIRIRYRLRNEPEPFSPFDVPSRNTSTLTTVQLVEKNLQGMTLCGVSGNGIRDGNSYDKNTKVWTVTDHKVRQVIDLFIEYCPPEGGSYPNPGSIFQHYAEIVSASPLPADPNNEYGNNSMDETDDSPVNHVTTLSPAASRVSLSTQSSMRNYCPRAKTKSPAACYHVSYYRIKNTGNAVINHQVVQVERSAGGRLLYSWPNRSSGFNVNNKTLSLTNMRPGQTKVLYMVHLDPSNGRQMQQVLKHASSSRQAKAAVLDQQAWVSGRSISQ